MKILILTQYFPPETGAAQSRLKNLALHLSEKGAEVTILTAMPNYPSMKIMESYRGKFHCCEEAEGLKIHRVWLYAGTSKAIVPRLLNYFSFVITSFLTGLFRLGHFDYLICESPPLFLGISGFLLSRIKKAKLIFNVSDLWPESAEKLGLVTNRFLLNLSTRLEEFLYRKSFMVTGQTKGIVNNIVKRFPQKQVMWLKNGAVFDKKEIPSSSGWRSGNGFSEDDFLLIYAGILGHAQGLEVILRSAEILKQQKKIKFIIIGDGPVKDSLKALRRELELENVFFFDPVPKNELNSIVSGVNAAIIPLKRIDLFMGAIPSKIFDNLFLKKPVLLGVEGEAKELFIDNAGAGLGFIPGDADDLSAKILQLYGDPEFVREAGEKGFNFLQHHFNWDKIIEEFWEKLDQKKT
ncbi:MAG: glycosyltransferase family 4 protein [Syntrophothermus sp.]